MDWTNIGIIIVGGSQIGIAILVFLKNYKNKINIIFSIDILLLSGWVISTAIFRLAPNLDLAYLIIKFKFFFGLAVAAVFQMFSVYFPYQKNKINFVSQSLLAGPALLAIFFIIFYPGLVIERIVLNPGDNLVIINKIYWILYSFSFTLSVLAAFYRLYIKLKEQGGFLRVTIFFVIISVLIPAIFGLVFNIFLLFFDVFIFDWLGAFLTFFFSIVLAYYIVLGGKRVYIK